MHRTGAAVSGFSPGDRVGVAWLRYTCGHCRYCLRGRENLCLIRDTPGGTTTAGTPNSSPCLQSSHFLSRSYDDVELAPLLCAGIIGFRALERAAVPEGGRLGIYGFGGSAHIAAQVAMYRGVSVHVMTRSADARALAEELGAESVQGSADKPPVPLDAAIVFAPVGDLIPTALEALDRGGILSLAGIHMTDVPPLNYQRHLFYEREIRSVTANTRDDARTFMRFAGEHRIQVSTMRYRLSDADRALTDLADDRVRGAAVLVPDRKFGATIAR